MTKESPFDPHTGKDPSEMTDEALYEAYQYAKQYGPVLRLDELQLEIAERWESEMEPLRNG